MDVQKLDILVGAIQGEVDELSKEIYKNLDTCQLQPQEWVDMDNVTSNLQNLQNLTKDALEVINGC